MDAKIAGLAKHDDVCRLMMTMPGVGPIVALTVKSAIDDPTRFARSKDVGPWAGLTPRRTQSGEMDIVGQITRAGDRGLANRVVSGSDDPDAPWCTELAAGLGTQSGAQAWIETGHDCTCSTHWRRFAPHVDETARRSAITQNSGTTA